MADKNDTFDEHPERMPGHRKGGRHKDHKVHFGWIHFKEGTNRKESYKQVKWKQGDGVRDANYSIEESQPVETLLELGKKCCFFPKGKSQMGTLGEMKIHLSQIDDTEIRVFMDRNGNECSYQKSQMKCFHHNITGALEPTAWKIEVNIPLK